MTSTLPKFKGVEFTFANGEAYVIPPLNLASIELLQDKLSSYTGGLDSDSVKLVGETAYMALRRNYPEMPLEYVKEELIDLANMGDVMAAVMDVGGLIRKAQEKEKAVNTGEAQPM